MQVFTTFFTTAKCIATSIDCRSASRAFLDLVNFVDANVQRANPKGTCWYCYIEMPKLAGITGEGMQPQHASSPSLRVPILWMAFGRNPAAID
jgi:hypothetical protein